MDGVLATQEAPGFQYPGLRDYIGMLYEWFVVEQQTAVDTASHPGGFRLLLGVIVYGDDYVDRFLQCCVPSLLAPGNVRALPWPTIIIHTDAASVDRIVAAVDGDLATVAHVEVHVVPQHIIDRAGDNPCNKYWLLSAAGTIHMQQAKHRGHGYHMLMPDHVYAMGYFANLSRLREQGQSAIVQGGLSAELETVLPLMKNSNGAIAPQRLTEIAVDNLHRQISHYVMNGRISFPKRLLMILVGARSVRIISPHLTIIFLSNEILQGNPVRLFNTMDTQLPFLIPTGVEPYVPGADDGMTYIELSAGEKPEHFAGDGLTIEEFCSQFWVEMHCSRAYEKYLGLTSEFPFGADYVPSIAPMDDDLIDAQIRAVRQAISESYDTLLRVCTDYIGDEAVVMAAG